MAIFSRFELVRTVTATAVLLLVLALGAVAYFISLNVAERIQMQAIDGQDSSLRVAATMIERDIRKTSVVWQKDGNVEKIVMETIPAAFPSHGMIDNIGRMTGQTATVFAYDPANKGFWRRTTNVFKPDGTRAVGTELDRTGAVYPVILQGETYRGQAVILGTSYYTIYKPIFSPSGDVIGILYAGVQASKIDAISEKIAWTIGLSSVLAIVIALILMTMVARSIVGPIQHLTPVATALASGTLDIEVPYQALRNEIGGLARALDVLRQESAEKTRLEQDAEHNRALKEEESRRFAHIERQKTDAMAQATLALGEGLRHLAEGDLSFQLNDPFSPDFESLRDDFNAALTQLSRTMGAVTAAVGVIDSGSREMRSAADDLSQRTEQQAAALEQTATALDEITANVASSSARVDEARRVAVQANDTAVQSGKVVADAVDAMGRIEQSSSQIVNIISVIDEIAFQTNLLALNAGVEAARAGEAGRGFAVVAQEVRELAQRSAHAAKEIKSLIRNSGIEVESGVKLVSQTGEVLRTIETYIVAINRHMDAIATSAQEQSIGLAEVNTAVVRMDHVTQQNAAMVEQSSAASGRLASESSRLRDLVTQFQVAGEAAARRPAQRVA